MLVTEEHLSYPERGRVGVGSWRGLVSGEGEGERTRSKKRIVLDDTSDDAVFGPQTTSTCNEVGVAVVERNGDWNSSSGVRRGQVKRSRMGPWSQCSAVTSLYPRLCTFNPLSTGTGLARSLPILVRVVVRELLFLFCKRKTRRSLSEVPTRR